MKKKIGIIGGAGPMASCLLYKKIIQECQQKYGCKDDADFPEIILISFPFSPMITLGESVQNKARIQAELQQCIDKLKTAGVEIFAIACNTLHSVLDAIDLRNMRCVHMPQEVLTYAKAKNLKKLLVLGTPTTIKSGIYDQQIKTLAPSVRDQEKITTVIDTLLSGIIQKKDTTMLLRIAQEIGAHENFDGIVLGYTELPILQEQYPLQLQDQKTSQAVPVLDSLAIVAEKLVYLAL